MRLTPAQKLELVMYLLGGKPIYDDYGNDTGEKTAQVITKEEAFKLLNFPEIKD